MKFIPSSVTTKDNGDGTQTVTTVTYKVDGTKSIKRKTEPIKPTDPNLPENANRATRNSFAHVASLETVKQVLQEVLGKGHADNPSFHKAVHRAIPAEFTLLASQDDVTQAQEDYFALEHYGLPDHHYGKAGSVATCALLQLLYENPKRVVAGGGNCKPWDCRQVLKEIQTRVQTASKLEAKPVITSSRPLGPPALNSNQYAPFYIVPPNFKGRRRALLIGVVAGKGADLQGPPNDITNMQDFLTQHCGFPPKDIVVLRDDIHVKRGLYKPSTKRNILDGFANLVKLSRPGDICYIQFSGHGGRLGDNLYILPSDFEANGHILDDDILLDLIKYMPAGIHTTMLVDCCYSGVIGDLPYTLHSNTQDGDPQRIGTYYDTHTRQETLQNERQPSQDYLAKKEARTKWKHVSRLTSIAKDYATEFAKDVEKGTSAFAEQARDVIEKKKAQAAERNQAKTQSATLKRSKTQPVPQNRTTTLPGDVRSSSSNAASPVRSRSAQRTRSPATSPRRTQTAHPSSASPAKAKPHKAARSVSPPKPIRRAQTTTGTTSRVSREPLRRRAKTAEEEAREFEEAARRAAIGQKEFVAHPERGLPRRAKSFDAAPKFDPDAAARRAAVERSQREAAAARRNNAARSGHQPSKTMEEIAMEREMLARRAAIERSKREAAEARGANAARSAEEEARRAAVERSRRERGEEAARRAEEEARRAAVERSRKEKEQKAAKKASHSNEEAARKEAVERSRREAAGAAARRAEEAARREAVERSRREKEEESARRAVHSAEEAARREAVERSKREAAEARQQK